MADLSPPPDARSRTTRLSPLILFFLSLAAGLTVASIYLVTQRLMREETELSQLGQGYSPAIAAPQPPTLTEFDTSTPADRAETFEQLRAQWEGEEFNFDRHFDQLILPEYNEAERYSWRLLGFRVALHPQATDRVPDRLAERERGK